MLFDHELEIKRNMQRDKNQCHQCQTENTPLYSLPINCVSDTLSTIYLSALKNCEM